ncbi:hypothetical protein ACOTFH_05300 [Achromobacter xylosoxidans]
MAAGFQLLSGASELIVDSSSINMFLRHAGVASNSAAVAAIDPVLFFRPVGEACYLSWANLSGGTLEFAFNKPAEYYVFDRPVTPSYLDAFNESGSQIFTAAQRPLNVIGSVNIPDYYTAYRLAYRDGWTYSGLVSGKYAYNQAFVRQGYNSLPGVTGWETYLMAEALQATANGFWAGFPQFGVRFLGWSPTRTNTFISYAPSPQVSIIDVAGIL